MVIKLYHISSNFARVFYKITIMLVIKGGKMNITLYKRNGNILVTQEQKILTTFTGKTFDEVVEYLKKNLKNFNITIGA